MLLRHVTDAQRVLSPRPCAVRMAQVAPLNYQAKRSMDSSHGFCY